MGGVLNGPERRLSTLITGMMTGSGNFRPIPHAKVSLVLAVPETVANYATIGSRR